MHIHGGASMPMIRRENILKQRFPWEIEIFRIFRSCAVPLSGRICIQYPDDHETGAGICGDNPKARSGVPGSDKKYMQDLRQSMFRNFDEEQMRMFRNLGCDYMIMGQHFLGSEEKGWPYTGTETEAWKPYPQICGSRNRRDADRKLCISCPSGSDELSGNGFGIRLGDDPVVQRNEGTGHSVGDQHARHGRRARHYPAERFWKIAGKSEIKRFSDWMPIVWDIFRMWILTENCMELAGNDIIWT